MAVSTCVLVQHLNFNLFNLKVVLSRSTTSKKELSPIKLKMYIENEIENELKTLLLKRESRLPLGLEQTVYVGPNREACRNFYEELKNSEGHNEPDGWFNADGMFVEAEFVLSIELRAGKIELANRQPKSLTWQSLSTQDRKRVLEEAKKTVERVNNLETNELPF